MLRRLICIALVTAHAPVMAQADDAQAEFLEFLADWDATEGALLDADEPDRGNEIEQVEGAAMKNLPTEEQP